MKAWWYRLSEREQRLIRISAILALVAAFWWGIWQPLQQQLQQSSDALKRAQIQYEQVQQQAEQILALRGSQPAAASQAKFSGSLSQLAGSTSKRYQQRISRMQPASDNRLQLYLDDSEFNQLLAWLAYLHGRGVTVDAVDLDAVDNRPGYVKIKRLVLRGDS